MSQPNPAPTQTFAVPDVGSATTPALFNVTAGKLPANVSVSIHPDQLAMMEDYLGNLDKSISTMHYQLKSGTNVIDAVSNLHQVMDPMIAGIHKITPVIPQGNGVQVIPTPKPKNPELDGFRPHPFTKQGEEWFDAKKINVDPDRMFGDAALVKKGLNILSNAKDIIGEGETEALGQSILDTGSLSSFLEGEAVRAGYQRVGAYVAEAGIEETLVGLGMDAAIVGGAATAGLAVAGVALVGAGIYGLYKMFGGTKTFSFSSLFG